MEKSTSEKSLSQRCPCGFWGYVFIVNLLNNISNSKRPNLPNHSYYKQY